MHRRSHQDEVKNRRLRYIISFLCYTIVIVVIIFLRLNPFHKMQNTIIIFGLILIFLALLMNMIVLYRGFIRRE